MSKRAAPGEAQPKADEASSLTAKEMEVLSLLAQGHSNKQIARALYVSDATVKTARPAMKTRRWPSRSPRRPASSSRPPNAIR